MSGRDSTKGAVDPPNYTQCPNSFLDADLPQITSLAELKITLAIMRQTFGYHKNEDELSISRLVELTGLHRDSVIEGVKLALARGTVSRRKSGQTYLYSLQVVGNSDQGNFSGSRDFPTQSSRDLPTQVVGNSDTQKKGKKEKESYPLPSETRSPQSEGPLGGQNEEDLNEEPTASDYVALLVERLRDLAVPLSEAWKGRFARDVKRELARGTTAEALDEGLDRIVERWDDYQLTLQQALSDVLQGRNGNGQNPNPASPPPAQEFPPSPPGVKEALLAHDVLARYAFLADKWDFTSLEQPPFKIEAKLGGDQEERWRNLDRVQSVARRVARSAKAAS